MPDAFSTRGSQGPATDQENNPVVDPTKNVLDLVTAAIQRQDDLRVAYQELLEQRFNSIEREFALIESRRVEQKVDTKVAVDAALSAAEKAVKEQTVASEKSIIKSETSAAEQSKQQNATFTAALKGVTDVLTDVKERVGQLETQRRVTAENRDIVRADSGNHGLWIGVAVSIMAVVISAAAIIAAVILAKPA